MITMQQSLLNQLLQASFLSVRIEHFGMEVEYPPCLKFLPVAVKLLSAVCIDFNYAVIMGDFKIHNDNTKEASAKELFSILDNFGLYQHVADSSHNKGHILNLVISKGGHITEVAMPYVVLPIMTVSFRMTSAQLKQIYNQKMQ